MRGPGVLRIVVVRVRDRVCVRVRVRVWVRSPGVLYGASFRFRVRGRGWVRFWIGAGCG